MSIMCWIYILKVDISVNDLQIYWQIKQSCLDCKLICQVLKLQCNRLNIYKYVISVHILYVKVTIGAHGRIVQGSQYHKLVI